MGRVRSIRTLKDKQGVAHKVRFVLKPCVRNKSHWKSRRCKQRYANYLSVRLCRNGERTSILVHALVAQAFIGPRPEGLVTDHINGDKYDNRAANLQYITNRENVIKGVCEHGSRSNFYRYKVVVSGLPDFSFESRSVSEISRQVKLNRGTLKWALWRKGIYQKNGITVTREKL